MMALPCRPSYNTSVKSEIPIKKLRNTPLKATLYQFQASNVVLMALYHLDLSPVETVLLSSQSKFIITPSTLVSRPNQN